MGPSLPARRHRRPRRSLVATGGAAAPDAGRRRGPNTAPAGDEALAGLADQPSAGLPTLDGEPVAAAAGAGTSRAGAAAAGAPLRARDARRVAARGHQAVGPVSAGRASCAWRSATSLQGD